MSTVVTVRIRREVKEILERGGVNISKVVKEFLEELAWKIKVEETLNKLDKLLEKMPPTPKGYAVKSVREDRDSR